MKIAQLKTLVKQGESESLEFKNSTGSIVSAMQTVCAFLNSDRGGTLIFGVQDNGQIIGQHVTDKTRKEIALELQKIEPHANIPVEYVKVDGERYAIIFIANPGEKAPYTYDARAFIRNQSTTMRMAKEDYVFLHNKVNPTLWESFTHNTAKISDLDRNRIKEVIQMAVAEKRLPASAMTAPIPDILEKLGLLVNGQLTNAAMILFCKDEYKQFLHCNVQLARFKGTDKSEFMDIKLYRANAFDLYDKAIDFLHFHLPVAARIEEGKSDRVEIPAIPHKVLREAVINALVHRAYSSTGGTIHIAVYDDRVNITNIGSLPMGIQLSQLTKAHPSVPRNPVIAHVFYLCRKIERWGRGTLDMIQESKKLGNPLPQYEDLGGCFSVTLPLKESFYSSINKLLQQIDQSALTNRQKEILDTLVLEPLTRSQLMAKMKVSLTNRTIQLELAKLKSKGLVISEGKGKATVWRVAI